MSFGRKKTNHGENTARQLETYAKPQRMSKLSVLQGAKQDKNTRWIPLDKIQSRAQVREHFDEEKMAELVKSFEVLGQKTACIVFWSEEDQAFVLIAGERRFRAAKASGKESLKCDVLDKEPSPEEIHELQLIENVQREDLTFLEEAKGYQRFVDDFGYSQAKIAERTGKSQATISRALKLMELPEDVRAQLLETNATRTLAAALVRLKTPEEQRQLLERHKQGELTAEQVGQETALSRSTKTRKPTSKQTRVKKTRGIDLKATGKKKHTNTDFALSTLDWCVDLATDKRAQVDIDTVISEMQQAIVALRQRTLRPAA